MSEPIINLGNAEIDEDADGNVIIRPQGDVIIESPEYRHGNRSTVYTVADDSELDDVLANKADHGDKIILAGEQGSRLATGSVDSDQYDELFTKNRTIDIEGLHFQGQLGFGTGSRLNADWTFNERVVISHVYLRGKSDTGGVYEFNGESQILNCRASQSDIQINSSNCMLSGIWTGTVTFASGTENGVISSSVNVDVTDNGNNMIGDVS